MKDVAGRYRKKVINFGSLNIDYVYQVDHMLKAGETLSSENMEVYCGGKGLNQSVAIAKAGIKPYHAGMIGLDGMVLKDFLEHNGVDVTYIDQAPIKSGHTIIQVDSNAQNSILVYPGANKCQLRNHIDRVLENFCSGDYLLLQNEINELDYIIDSAYGRGLKIILNPSPFNGYLSTCDLAKVSFFILNEVEGEALSGYRKPHDILKSMKDKFPNADILLTFGDKGSYYADTGNIYYQEIYPVKAIDTTAAGDTFTGYFVTGLIEGLLIQENMKRCAKAASITVSREGAAQSIPHLDELWKG